MGSGLHADLGRGGLQITSLLPFPHLADRARAKEKGLGTRRVLRPKLMFLTTPLQVGCGAWGLGLAVDKLGHRKYSETTPLWLSLTGTSSTQHTFLKIRIQMKPRPSFWHLLCSTSDVPALHLVSPVLGSPAGLGSRGTGRMARPSTSRSLMGLLPLSLNGPSPGGSRQEKLEGLFRPTKRSGAAGVKRWQLPLNQHKNKVFQRQVERFYGAVCVSFRQTGPRVMRFSSAPLQRTREWVGRL